MLALWMYNWPPPDWPIPPPAIAVSGRGTVQELNNGKGTVIEVSSGSGTVQGN